MRHGPNGPRGSATATRWRSPTRGRSSATTSATGSICSGWRRISGRRRGRRPARWSCSATCPSWWRSTAPTCGRARAISASTPRSACRPTRSARPDRTGSCRSTSGMSLPRAALPGCISGPGAMPPSSAATAWITSSGSTARSRVRWATASARASSRRADEPAQTALGERVLGVFLASGAQIVAEDLGVVPDFVRASLARMQVAGCKVFRWERLWHQDGAPVRGSRVLPGAVGRDLRHARHRADGHVVGVGPR